MRKRAIAQHPALALMRHEAKGYLVRFETDLNVHDAAALATHRPTDAFAWVLHSGATYMAFMGAEYRKHAVARMFVNAYGADESRFYFWDGACLTRYGSASALDERIADFEEQLRERARAGELADRGIA
jgi:hypothetical protein